MCVHGAISIPFQLICNMTTFRKKCFVLSGVDGVCKDRMCAFMVLYVPFPLI